MWEQFIAELRVEHLGAAGRSRLSSGSSAGAKLQAAHAAVVARKAARGSRRAKPKKAEKARRKGIQEI